MMRRTDERRRWLIVALFAVAMAWLESATVYYIRVLVDRVQPYQPNPLPVHGVLGPVELVREAATLVMLLTAGMLAGQTWREKIGYTAIAFGLWDIFYYVFLHIICGWPTSPLDWDILFLLPLPWWGPVLAPVSIALLMIAWGTLATQSAERNSAGALPWTSWILTSVGIALALFIFMADALRVMHQGPDAVRGVLPTTFDWPLFCVALTLMAVPLVQGCSGGSGGFRRVQNRFQRFKGFRGFRGFKKVQTDSALFRSQEEDRVDAGGFSGGAP